MYKPGKIQYFSITFIILISYVKGQMDSADMDIQGRFNPDVIHDLSDKDLKSALSDLSLKDLKSLKAFIDSVDYADSDYQGNRKAVARNTDASGAQEYDYNMDHHADQEEYNFGPQNKQKKLMNYLKLQADYHQLVQENQRTKRDDRMSYLNDEYIKQLDYSFPQNEQLNNNNNNNDNDNNNDDVELKKPHIRVKRYIYF